MAEDIDKKVDPDEADEKDEAVQAAEDVEEELVDETAADEEPEEDEEPEADEDESDEDEADEGESDDEPEDEPEDDEEPADKDEKADAPKKKSKSQRRREEKEAAKAARAAYTAVPEKEKSTVSTAAAVAIGVIALVLGLLVGKFLLNGIGGHSGSDAIGVNVLAESDLDTVVGSYTYAGDTHSITAREVIENDTGLELARNEDGTFNVPSAESVLAYARNDILAQEVEARGITVTDEDVAAYAESILGSSDYATIAETYMLDEATVVALMTQSAQFAKLREQIVTIEEPTLVDAPAEPAEGDEETATADYANYIIGLAGDEWDATNNTWAATDGMYAMSLEGMNFDGKTADYAAALTAYYVAYQQYAQVQADISAQWTNYVNGLLANSSFEAYTMSAS